MFDNLYQPDLSIGFIWVVALTFYLLIRSIEKEKAGTKNRLLTLLLLLAVLTVHGLVSASGFYKDFSTVPPRIFLAAGPSVAAVLLIVFLKPRWIEVFSLKKMTWLHTVRVFVEIILFGLAVEKQVPDQMTFDGTNFDILSGLTAPLIALTCFRGGKPLKAVLLPWNIICLGLLVNVVVTAVLSAPTPFQQLNFSQPNVAVGFFPFAWLPAFVVPVVLFCHLATLRVLLSKPL